MNITKDDLRNADWDAMESEVVLKLRLLRAWAKAPKAAHIDDQIANDLILPLLADLAKFCTAITHAENASKIESRQ